MEKNELHEIEERYRQFLADDDKRVFIHRFKDGRSEVDFCICRSSVHGPLETLWLHLRYGIVLFALNLPWSWPKVFVLRLFGATIGDRVYISQRALIDPLYPQLLTIGDDVLIGYDAKIFFHEVTQRAYRVGRVKIGDKAIIGASAIIRPGINIGEGAEVGALTAVTHSVKAGTVVFGVPGKVIAQEGKENDDQ